jgi:hypothetical protein
VAFAGHVNLDGSAPANLRSAVLHHPLT